MSSTGGAVRGKLLRWAREQQGLTMRHIMSCGGPSPGYQCEVEIGKKTEVLSDKLAQWIAALGVTESFARGQIPKYTVDPAACRGLAADVGMRITTSPLDVWQGMSEVERVREVLRRIVHESRSLPRLVLAWVLDTDVSTLDALISGEHPIMELHFRAVADLTTIPEAFFTKGELTPDTTLLEAYLPAIRMAVQLGISPYQLGNLLGCVRSVATTLDHGRRFS